MYLDFLDLEPRKSMHSAADTNSPDTKPTIVAVNPAASLLDLWLVAISPEVVGNGVGLNFSTGGPVGAAENFSSRREVGDVVGKVEIMSDFDGFEVGMFVSIFIVGASDCLLVDVLVGLKVGFWLGFPVGLLVIIVGIIEGKIIGASLGCRVGYSVGDLV